MAAWREDTLAQEGGLPGIRDEGLLASAVEMPQAMFGGQYLHTGLAEMAAAPFNIDAARTGLYRLQNASV